LSVCGTKKQKAHLSREISTTGIYLDAGMLGVIHDGAGQGVERYEVSQHPCSLPARKKFVPKNMDNLTNKIP
jgi:hypothetical protein